RPAGHPLEFMPPMCPAERPVMRVKPVIGAIAVTADDAAEPGSQQGLGGGLTAMGIDAKQAGARGHGDPQPLPRRPLAMSGFIHIDDGRLLDLSLEGGDHRFQRGTQLPLRLGYGPAPDRQPEDILQQGLNLAGCQVIGPRQPADQGHDSAQLNLGTLYYQGKGAPQDYAEALKWYGRAADLGNGRAQYNLGVMYAKGQGVPADLVQAFKWLTLAQERGDKDAAALLAEVSERMTPDQVAGAQDLLKTWRL
ncbi:MAG: sel1 repeat family protein, partial [Anaerolineales bacterium]|nr:sel1 repeat family protein [Anaerolineales bacterium]